MFGLNCRESLAYDGGLEEGWHDSLVARLGIIGI
jgi:hypothetical protein